MPDVVAKSQSDRDKPGRRRLSLLLPLFGVVGALVAMMLVYFGYDYVLARTTPCEAIFRQAQLGLSTKISFLKTEGEVKIGREPLIELTERAQMTALNLKTCCTVLDAGKLDPEQFLQCKSKARAYEAKVDDIVTVVRKTKTVEKNVAGSASAATPAQTIVAKIKPQIEAARAISKTFNKEVLTMRKAQALETLEVLPPRHFEVNAREREPNNDGLNTNVIELEKWITASIGSGRDADFYAFTTPEKHRDWIRIELENRSATLEPRIELFDAQKVSLGVQVKKTYGANLVYHFVSAPNTRYFIRVSNYWGETVGAYLVRVVAGKSYDAHEPNDSKLEARPIAAGEKITAAIMDGRDIDVYRVEAADKAKQIEVALINRSTTLRPRLEVYDGNKAFAGDHTNKTPGADLKYALIVAPGSAYYVLVRDYYGDAAGAYEMTINFR